MPVKLFSNSLYYYSLLGRKAYKELKKDPHRQDLYNRHLAALNLSYALGIIEPSFQIGKKLSIVKEVAFALKELRNEGFIKEIFRGRVVLSPINPPVNGKTAVDIFLEKLQEKLPPSNPYGITLNKPLVLNSQARELLLENKSKENFPSNSPLFYRFLISRLSIDMAAGKKLRLHNQTLAEKISADFSVDAELEDLMARAIKTARETSITEIKKQLLSNSHVIYPLKGALAGCFDIIISDVHLQDFKHENTEELLRLIYHVKLLNGRLIFNGDTFDFWRSVHEWKVLEKNKDFLTALSKLKEVVFIVGNHDEHLKDLDKNELGVINFPLLINSKVVSHLTYPYERIKILHGHQFDHFNRPGSFIGPFITKLINRPFRWLTRGSFFKAFSRIFIVLIKKIEFLAILPKLFLPVSYIKRKITENILKWLAIEREKAQKEGIELSPDKPLTFIIGHFHFTGFSFLVEKIMETVKTTHPDLRLFFTDSWEYEEGYIGDYITLLRPNNKYTLGKYKSYTNGKIKPKNYQIKIFNGHSLRKEVWWRTKDKKTYRRPPRPTLEIQALQPKTPKS